VAPKDRLIEIEIKIKKKIAETDKKLATHGIFLFAQNKLLNNRDMAFEEINNKHRNFKDGVLYLFFANV
jgi:hypothetical protein